MHMSIIIETLSNICNSYGDKAAFTYVGEDGFSDITYNTYLKAVSGIQKRLRRVGCTPGDRVVLLADYSPKWCAAYMGIHASGCTAIPMDAQYNAREVANIINFTEPAAVLTDASHAETLPNTCPETIMIDTVYEDISADAVFELGEFPDGTPMSIIFTSGTTGDPKGVMLSPENFMSNVNFIREFNRLITHKDVILSVLPLHHVYGFTGTFLAPVLNGATTVFPKTISGPDIVDAVQKTGVTFIVAVPQILTLFHKKIFTTVEDSSFLIRDIFRTMKDITRFSRKFGINPGRLLFRKVHRMFPCLRFFTSGGARLEPQILKDLHDIGFNIIEAYGLTETSPIACVNHPTKPMPGSVGKPIANVEIKIEKTESGFEQGEVCIKGPNVMMGYYNRKEATDKAIIDGWFHSGDIGYQDKNGNVFLTGRAKEIIILPNGKNIYPEELEKLYMRTERIAEVCVLPLGEKGKEKLTAAVHPNMDYFRKMGKSSIFQEVKYGIENTANDLPSYQRVTRIEIIDREFPRTRLGKLKRFKIKEWIENRETSKEEQKVKNTTTEDPFLQFLMSELKLDFVPDKHHNLETDLGLDSLAKIELFAGVEITYGTKIKPEQAGEIISVGHLHAVIGDAAANGRSGGFNIAEEMKSNPDVPLNRHVSEGFGVFGGMFRFFIHFVLWIFLKVFFKTQVKGIENLPKNGQFIIAGNHVSYCDALIIYGMMPYRVTRGMYSMSIPEIFEQFPLNLIRSLMRVIMTGTHDTMIKSMQYSYQVLKGGSPMCIFPEGKRSVDGKLDIAKPGVFHLSKECNAPLVPVYLSGVNNVYSRKNPGFHLTKFTAEVLPPIKVTENIQEMIDAWYDSLKPLNEKEYDEI